MKYRTTPWFLIAIAGAWIVSSGTTDAQRLVMLLGRDTGSMEVINPGSDPVNVNGYAVTSSSGLLNVETWNSLTDQGMPGFVEANPRDVEIAELAFPPASAPWGGGDTVSLGNAYRGGSLLPHQEDVGFRFTAPDGAIFDGTVKYLGPSQVPSVTVDRVSGNVQLSNPAGFAIDGYTISSPSGLLLADTFTGLADQNVAGWIEAQPTNLFISELNIEGSQAFEGGATFDLGNAYNAAAGVPKSGEDLAFRYSMPEGDVRDGVVTYAGPINDLVLQVDSINGDARIQNSSSTAGPFDIVAYNIFSASGSLSVEGWNSLADSGSGGAGWAEANPRPDALAELNPSGSTVFETGTSISIGRILAGSEDLVFQYATVDGSALGSVDYVVSLGPPTVGDCNGDGVVDAGDLSCVSSIGERDFVLGVLNTLPGDLDGNGVVAFPDFLTLSANFGQDLPSYTDGNIDLVGGIDFPDFLTLSANFGKTPGATAAAVPEPTAGVLALVGLLVCLCGRKKTIKTVG